MSINYPINSNLLCFEVLEEDEPVKTIKGLRLDQCSSDLLALEIEGYSIDKKSSFLNWLSLLIQDRNCSKIDQLIKIIIKQNEDQRESFMEQILHFKDIVDRYNQEDIISIAQILDKIPLEQRTDFIEQFKCFLFLGSVNRNISVSNEKYSLIFVYLIDVFSKPLKREAVNDLMFLMNGIDSQFYLSDSIQLLKQLVDVKSSSERQELICQTAQCCSGAALEERPLVLAALSKMRCTKLRKKTIETVLPIIQKSKACETRALVLQALYRVFVALPDEKEKFIEQVGLLSKGLNNLDEQSYIYLELAKIFESKEAGVNVIFPNLLEFIEGTQGADRGEILGMFGEIQMNERELILGYALSLLKGTKDSNGRLKLLQAVFDCTENRDQREAIIEEALKLIGDVPNGEMRAKIFKAVSRICSKGGKEIIEQYLDFLKKINPERRGNILSALARVSSEDRKELLDRSIKIAQQATSDPNIREDIIQAILSVKTVEKFDVLMERLSPFLNDTPSSEWPNLIFLIADDSLNTIIVNRKQLEQKPWAYIEKVAHTNPDNLKIHFIQELALDAGGVKREFFRLAFEHVIQDPICFRTGVKGAICLDTGNTESFIALGKLIGMILQRKDVVIGPIFDPKLYNILQMFSLEDLNNDQPSKETILAIARQCLKDEAFERGLACLQKDDWDQEDLFFLKALVGDENPTHEALKEMISGCLSLKSLHALAKGIYSVIKAPFPQNLQQIVEGRFNLQEIAEACACPNEANEAAQIQMSWLKEWIQEKEEHARSFLIFATGSPTLMTNHFKIKIEHVLESSKKYPKSWTCLLLVQFPQNYSLSREQFLNHLQEAIKHSEGSFGMQ